MRANARPPEILILPGRGNSGPGHWQTLWQVELLGCRRVMQHEWQNPLLADWLLALGRAVQEASGPVVLVAHSLACALVAHFGHGRLARKVVGALLVAPADVEARTANAMLSRQFAPVPRSPLPFKTIVVASDNDPFIELPRAQAYARDWGAVFVNVGHCGHINVLSGHGAWPEGRRLLDRLVTQPLTPSNHAAAALSLRG